MGQSTRYWVIGGEYTDTAFTRIKDGTQTIAGPYADYQQALKDWRDLSEENRGDACLRYSIATEGAMMAAAASAPVPGSSMRS
ncbi:hypothetical protein C882_3570 [Caenispirillum salinarum AK4]|uniref:DUF4170 domain-containing protein n=1 Tax=Caenispirillum salinarum AK4 TaxID=1238182 RepID=K9H424_9PROT|nr:DUF4170 domain-containing protein [Caenispirillum salinarum]EKV31819.1 hypothetical protein C882_3570 [Caenispirillum salinarum AK4]